MFAVGAVFSEVHANAQELVEASTVLATITRCVLCEIRV
jgi:hypothetical protein